MPVKKQGVMKAECRRLRDQGHTTVSIAKKLNISVKGVEYHLAVKKLRSEIPENGNAVIHKSILAVAKGQVYLLADGTFIRVIDADPIMNYITVSKHKTAFDNIVLLDESNTMDITRGYLTRAILDGRWSLLERK